MSNLSNVSYRLMSLFALQVCAFVLAACVVQTTTAKHVVRDYHNNNNSHHDEYNNHHQHHYQYNKEGPNPRRRLQRDSTATNTAINNQQPKEQCDTVRGYFQSIDIKLNGIYDEKGAICSGSCCSNATEMELQQKATIEFERLLHHHITSLRDVLLSTSNLFQTHILELAEQSQNKTLNVFSQVYRHMMADSRKLVEELYTEIMNRLTMNNEQLNDKNNNNNNNNNSYNLISLEESIQKFFVNLFPMAYHQAVHLSKENYGDLHEDYNNCLKHSFDELQPFGNIPKEVKRQLLQSVQTAQIFMSSLKQSADILSETDHLHSLYLTEICQKQLLKMHYCPSCNGFGPNVQVKTCYSYCMNVYRGCAAQYASVIDGPWSNVVDAIDNLVSSHIRSDNGIVTVIKQLYGKLSETIMCAMENGPELEKKVKKTCGTPRLIPSEIPEPEARKAIHNNLKWATPADAEILRFLTTIEKSKEFYSNIVNNVCEDEDVQRNDHDCWTGERISDYTQLVMTSGADTQRYNPEVPLEVNAQAGQLNGLVDKLIKIRKNIASALPSTSRSYSDIQGDMARRDEEGSGRLTDDVDDEEYGNLHGSGDGSGNGATSTSFDATGPPILTSNDIEQRSIASIQTTQCSLMLIFMLVTNIFGSRQLLNAIFFFN